MQDGLIKQAVRINVSLIAGKIRRPSQKIRARSVAFEAFTQQIIEWLYSTVESIELIFSPRVTRSAG
jgi:hypothetical protein